jgi:tRNA(Ile)-lysidine synthase
MHIHHGLSPNADAWEAHCREICGELGVSLSVSRIDVPRDLGTGIEDAARGLRHRLLNETPTDWVLLAHHAGDQAETLLLNLFRGAGLRGISAMQERRLKQLRPLLPLPRTALLLHAKRHGLRWIEDESNLSTAYTRNYIRHQVMPVLEERFHGVEIQLAAASRRFGEAQSLLDELASMDCGANLPVFPLPLNLLQHLSDGRVGNVLRFLLVRQEVQSPDDKRLREFVRQMKTAGSDRHPRLDLPKYSLWVSGRQLHFQAVSA